MSTTTPDHTVRTSDAPGLEAMRGSHEVLLEVPFRPSEPECGYSIHDLAITKKHREDRSGKPRDAVGERRGWRTDGVPTVATLKELGIDLPEVVELVKRHGG